MEKIDRESAARLARERVDQLALEASDQFELLSDLTEEVEQGWIFFFNSKEFVQTRNPMSALAGNGPILVTRYGVVLQLPSGMPWQDAVRDLK